LKSGLRRPLRSKKGNRKGEMGRHSEGKTPTIGQLWPHHRSMARTMVAGGLTPKQLAALYGFTPSHVTRIINSPMFLAEIARLEEDAEEVARDVSLEIKKLAERAVEILDDQMNKAVVDDKIRQKAALEILDRSGYGKKDGPKLGPGAHLHLHDTKVQVNNMSREELKNDVMDLVEADYDEEEKG